MNASRIGFRRFATGAAFLVALWTATSVGAAATDTRDDSLVQQIFDAMVHDPGTKPGYRVAHAKGIVCEGTFLIVHPRGDALEGGALPAVAPFR